MKAPPGKAVGLLRNGIEVYLSLRAPKGRGNPYSLLRWGYGETTGLDLIKVRLGQALAGGAHPRRI